VETEAESGQIFVEAEAFDFLRSRKRSIFHKTWGRDVEEEPGSG